MKKLLTVLVLVSMIFSLGACGSKQEEAPAPAPEVTEVTYKLGVGTVVSLDSSKTGNAQVDATVAAVILDEEGKIVDCVIDVAQSKTAIGEDGTIETEGVTFLSKAEKQFDYNMVAFSEATLEWFEQAANFADYCVGKTGAEVAATQTRVRGEDEPHPGYVVAADEELFAQCSITVTDFIEAVSKACNDEQGKTFVCADECVPTVGLKLLTSLDSSSKSATAEEEGAANMYTTYAAAAVCDGVIEAAVVDAIQPKISFDAAGEITNTAFKATKRELKMDYNMVAYSEATLEWFEQSANFTDYCAGKTAAEVLATETRVRGEDEPHPGYVVAADEELFAQCSINIVDMMNVVADAANNAK